MAVYVSNITIPAGEDFEQVFILENLITNSSFDLSNYEIYSSLKKHSESLNTTATFDVEILDELLGIVQISLASSITSEIRPGRYSYDILINNGGVKKRAVEGSALVTGGVTKI